MTEAIISVAAKCTRRKVLSTNVYAKRVMHACPPHVAGMIPCVVLTRGYASSSRYAVTLGTYITGFSTRGLEAELTVIPKGVWGCMQRPCPIVHVTYLLSRRATPSKRRMRIGAM